jgi:hypothetical protein
MRPIFLLIGKLHRGLRVNITYIWTDYSVCGRVYSKLENVHFCTRSKSFLAHLEKSPEIIFILCQGIYFKDFKWFCELFIYAVMVNELLVTILPCSGSVTFCYGSGSADPYLWLMDLAPDPAFCQWASKRQQKVLFCLLPLRIFGT